MVGVLKARVGGSWVDIAAGAIDEVWVGPSAPTDPNVQMWFDTDAPAVQDANVAWGYIGSDTTSGQVALSTTAADMGARVTWTANPSRRYRTTLVTGNVAKDATAAHVYMSITTAAGGGGTLIERGTYIAANNLTVIMFAYIESSLSGSITRNIQGRTSAGGGFSNSGLTVLVEDIGPVVRT
jgi:hypothetical protein